MSSSGEEGKSIGDWLDRLEEHYGPVRFRCRFNPMEELVSCILSQHTSDTSSFPAFIRLREALADWRDVEFAPREELASLIKGAGLSNQKSKGIQACLKSIREQRGDYDLDFLRELPMSKAREWLESLPMVGPKTASIVLSFALGMPAIPVDTHIYRVSKRLGFVPESVNEARAHDFLLEVVPEVDAFRFHCLLIEHGRKTCKAQKPRCSECPLLHQCQSARISSGNNSIPLQQGKPNRKQKSSKS